MPELHYANVNGIRLHYAREGEGPLMLFVHGYPRHWYLWRNQLAEFGRDHLAVAPDLRGYNLSDKPEDVLEYGVWKNVEDLRALADHLGHERFVLVGHDWGSAIAWSFALHHPDRLHALVTMCGTHPALLDRDLRENEAYAQQAKFMLGLRNPRAPERLAADGWALLRPTIDLPYLTDEDREVYLEAWNQPGAARWSLANDRREGMGPASSKGVPARGNYAPEINDPVVRVPTLVLWADQDPYTAASNFEGIEDYVEDVTVRPLKGTHFVPEEQPDVVNREIRDFIGARVPAPA